jgi:hypothetical protein
VREEEFHSFFTHFLPQNIPNNKRENVEREREREREKEGGWKQGEIGMGMRMEER